MTDKSIESELKDVHKKVVSDRQRQEGKDGRTPINTHPRDDVI